MIDDDYDHRCLITMKNMYDYGKKVMTDNRWLRKTDWLLMVDYDDDDLQWMMVDDYLK